MKTLVIFKVGDTFSSLAGQLGDFDQWIIDQLGPLPLPVTVVDPRREDELPPVSKIAGAIVTGAHSMVTDRAQWSEDLAAWLRSAVSDNVPVLGICYGHQLLAHALGGEVGYHPGGIELGTVFVKLTSLAKNDSLFRSMPETFAAQVVHRQSVLRLPSGAVLLAANDFEPHQAFRVGSSAWGVQFHPEFSPAAMSGYIKELTQASITGEPETASPMGAGLPTEDAASILPRFANFVKERMGDRKEPSEFPR